MEVGPRRKIDLEEIIRSGLTDRTKDMIIVSGFKVFSRKVEDVLIQHPAIDMVVVIGMNNRNGRFGDREGLCRVSSQKRYRGLKKDMLDFAEDKLTPYEVPKILETRTDLPQTLVGKIDKKVLRKETGER